MKQNEQQYKIAVETQWNIYSNPYCDYHKVYSAYTKLVKYIEKGIIIGYKWIKDFIKSPSSKFKTKFKWKDVKDYTFKKWTKFKDYCSKKWDSFKNWFKSKPPKP